MWVPILGMTQRTWKELGECVSPGIVQEQIVPKSGVFPKNTDRYSLPSSPVTLKESLLVQVFRVLLVSESGNEEERIR